MSGESNTKSVDNNGNSSIISDLYSMGTSSSKKLVDYSAKDVENGINGIKSISALIIYTSLKKFEDKQALLSTEADLLFSNLLNQQMPILDESEFDEIMDNGPFVKFLSGYISSLLEKVKRPMFVHVVLSSNISIYGFILVRSKSKHWLNTIISVLVPTFQRF